MRNSESSNFTEFSNARREITLTRNLRSIPNTGSKNKTPAMVLMLMIAMLGYLSNFANAKETKIGKKSMHAQNAAIHAKIPAPGNEKIQPVVNGGMGMRLR